MEKENKKLILGIVIGIIFVIIINAVFSQILPDSSYKTEIRYYKDGKIVGELASDVNLCEDDFSCLKFGADQYKFIVEPNQMTIRADQSNCKDEFEKRIGKKLNGFCELEYVNAQSKDLMITNYACDCWSN